MSSLNKMKISMSKEECAEMSLDEEPLTKLFDDAMKIFEAIEKSNEPTNSNSTQLSVKSAISKFEKATNLVSLAEMFSRNEGVEELPTETLRYLLLPALLGTLTLKLCNQPRIDLVNVAEIYYKDFLQRCKDYGVTDLEVPSTSDSRQVERPHSEQAKIASLVQTREAKIRRYKQAQELKDQLAVLSKAMESSADDETKRAYFLKLLQSYINQAFEELSSIEQEKSILEYMAKNAGEPKPAERPRAPLRPVIITRDELQKAVFGAGYPAIPSLTVEEFYDQRVREGLFPGACTSIPHTTIQSTENDPDEEERIRKELLEEQDDPEERARKNNMDEYKDEHRRGWGNRHNRS
ncbi:unnamed protein product [Spodoptera littoralis]|uniref:Immunoglobulin-binding protein 1 n=1 Tax=Spodoptera littoralis TaxID=7109 RepID=A0A9P0I5R7_SPOLI|nr:unnamed protein product [Spodoptera littoralis]CAH1639393.1 unnamed protein product [Spodoptera littoralis]